MYIHTYVRMMYSVYVCNIAIYSVLHYMHLYE